MSDADAPQAVITEAHDDHDAGHGHEPADEPLGPPDLLGWGYALLGGAVGLAVVVALYIATQA